MMLMGYTWLFDQVLCVVVLMDHLGDFGLNPSGQHARQMTYPPYYLLLRPPSLCTFITFKMSQWSLIIWEPCSAGGSNSNLAYRRQSFQLLLSLVCLVLKFNPRLGSVQCPLTLLSSTPGHYLLLSLAKHYLLGAALHNQDVGSFISSGLRSNVTLFDGFLFPL